MKCPNCGEYFVDGEDRCPTCDHPLTPAAHRKSTSPPRVQSYPRRTIAIIALVFLAGCILGLVHTAFSSRIDKREWAGYHSDDGQVSVRLPNEPDEKETALTLADGSTAIRHSLISTTKTCTYYVEYIDYAADQQHTQDLVPRFILLKRNELIKAKGTPVLEKSSRYLGYPGVYFIYKLPWVRVREHMLAKGNRIYSIRANYRRSRAEEVRVSFFFSSVHLTDD